MRWTSIKTRGVLLGAPGLRLWPGLLLVAIEAACAYGTGYLAPGTLLQFFGHVATPILALIFFFGWWLFASRAPRTDRRWGAWLPPLAIAATIPLSDPSALFPMLIYGLPVLCLAFVAWAHLGVGWRETTRRRTLIAMLAAYCGLWLLIRSDGVDGDMGVHLAPRFAATAEERLLAEAEPVARTTTARSDLAAITAAWPGFRGPERDSVVRATRIGTDWSETPPEVLWRRPVGPGWGSFAIVGDLLITQEQRGDDEVVAAYRLSDGAPVWLHRDTARFWEALAGPGPRGTPTFDAGTIYTLGATGILNALGAADGERRWSRDITVDTEAAVPDWGFASSPLVLDGMVVVHTGAESGRAVVAYESLNGEPRWYAAVPGPSYSSAHLATIDGVRQILMPTGSGIAGLDPADGTVLWQHEWPVPGGARIVQPALLDDGLLLGTGFGMGVRRLGLTLEGDRWQVENRWTSNRLKPYFNDIVTHDGFVYGFDGRILACLDGTSGERVWKGGRYGSGQVMLLADQDLLLVLSERGAIALVAADPAAYRELAKYQAIEGKTWNHPVLIDDILYVRNGEEMAALRLPTIGR